jgi:uncharacterized protein YqjF (DUF2071 family)
LSEIDRIAPARRPEERNAGTQRWRHLLFLHWVVPAEALRAVVPRGLELDPWQGEHYVGVVPFVMKDIAASWMPQALALNFLETNVRTYVVHDGRPGVFFLSLEASSRLAVHAARVQWGLPYHFAEMEIAHEPGEVIAYRTRRRTAAAPSLQVRYRIGAPLGPSLPGTLEHFLLERYLLFLERRGRIWSGQVHHPPYPAHGAELLEVQDGLVVAGGLPAVQGAPKHVHYAPGVDVEVFAIR